MVKNWPANAGDTRVMGSVPGLGRSPEEGNGNPLQYSCLENPWTEEPDGLQSIGLQSQTQLKQRKQASNWNINCKIGLNLPTFEKVNLPASERETKAVLRHLEIFFTNL